MPWIDVDGSPVHYTPAPGAKVDEEALKETVRRAIREGDEGRKRREATMPTEQDALRVMFDAYTRLKELGWRDAIYCPKDGSSFDVIEAGSSGIHRAHYEGEWPKGTWWVEEAGDLWPSRPCLYRPSPEEQARWTALRERMGAQTPSANASPSPSEATARPLSAPDAGAGDETTEGGGA